LEFPSTSVDLKNEVRAVKFVEGTQLPKRTMVLSQFTKDMESKQTDDAAQKPNTDLETGSNYATIEIGSDTDEEDLIQVDIQTTMNTLPSNVEGNATMAGEMIMLDLIPTKCLMHR